MSEYTKEQEAGAIERLSARTTADAAEGWSNASSQYAVRDIRVVLAMAKRTAEAEERLRLTVEARVGLIDKLAIERDALKARVAELERIANDYREERDIAERKLSAPKDLSAPPVVVTREMVEALREFVNLHALWMSEPRTDDDLTKPLNAAARAVVAMNAALEVTP